MTPEVSLTVLKTFLRRSSIQQECIPVGCVPPAAVAMGGAWTRSSSTSPLGVGLDLIPLKFPLVCLTGDPLGADPPGADPRKQTPLPGADPPQEQAPLLWTESQTCVKT